MRVIALACWLAPVSTALTIIRRRLHCAVAKIWSASASPPPLLSSKPSALLARSPHFGDGHLGLFQCFNGNFVASSRLLSPWPPPNHSRAIRPHSRKISDAVIAILGIAAHPRRPTPRDALLVPVTEVGSMASAFGWLATCVSFFLVERNLRSRSTHLLRHLVAALLRS